MALRDKLRERVQPLLDEGESVEQVFLTQTGPTPWLQGFMGGILLLFFVKRRIIVVTNRRIVVVEAGKVMGTTAKKVLAEVPRATTIGPISGLWSKINLAGENMWVHRRFKKDIDEANTAVPPSAPPAPPTAPST